ncbi:hypothetical protein GCM10022403_087740 [Streptomyces coacervatus]|uniref:Uncharacterized protein n=1 Tax=Streptomyces coacervatus TaxID=647381 RepID=A0ABP7JFG6_9ACTN
MDRQQPVLHDLAVPHRAGPARECDRLGCLYAPDLPERWTLFVVTFSHYLGAVDTEMSTPASLGGSFHAVRYEATIQLALIRQAL